MTNNLTICRCNLCSGEIEFEAARAGETITCPHCAMETVLYLPGGSRPSDPRQKSATPPAADNGEQRFHQRNNVLVTNLRFVVGAKTYAMSGITSVELDRADAHFLWPLLWGCFGGLMAAIPDTKVIGWFILIASVAVIAHRLRPKYQVNVTTASGESTALESYRYAEIKEIVDALNNAILSRG